jgi:hypothetical protein
MLQPWPIAKAYSQDARSALSCSRSWSRSCTACLTCRCARRVVGASPLALNTGAEHAGISARTRSLVHAVDRRASVHHPITPTRPTARSLRHDRSARCGSSTPLARQNSLRPTAAAGDPEKSRCLQHGVLHGSPERPRDPGGSCDRWQVSPQRSSVARRPAPGGRRLPCVRTQPSPHVPRPSQRSRNDPRGARALATRPSRP